MPTPADPAFRARLAALNDKFAATVPGILEKITQALAACVALAPPAAGTAPPEAAVRALHELLHGVAGSAGTFGFPTLGREARHVEHMVRQVLTEGSGWTETVPAVEKFLAWAARDPRAEQFD